MSVAFLFPGQGSQYDGMLHKLPDDPAVTRTFKEVSDTLKADVLTLDSTAALGSTVAAQLCILTAGVAVARVLDAAGVKPMAVAGLSVGAFTAAVSCGVLTLSDAVLLVKRRAELMQKLFSTGYGLSAIVGLPLRKVKSLIAATQETADPVYLANINTAKQLVIAGSDNGMQVVLEAAKNAGASKAERLDVAVPSHCELLAPVASELTDMLRQMRLSEPNAIFIGNINARALRSASEISADIANNIANSVRWFDGNILLKELGCNLFLEMNPGNVLTKLANENVPDVRAESLEYSSIKHAVKLALKMQTT